jgi:hypothetical protein
MCFYPMDLATLEPDIRMPYSFDDYVSLRDPVLERTLETSSTRRQVPQ